MGEKKKEKNAPQQAMKEDKKKKEAPKKVEGDIFPLLDLRVGKVLEVKAHPDSGKIFIEKIDVGEAEPRTILSGLRQFVKAEDFVNRNVLVICNLKPRKIVGIPSNGMVMCCSNADHSAVTLVESAEGVAAGTRVLTENQEVQDGVFPAVLNPK